MVNKWKKIITTRTETKDRLIVYQHPSKNNINIVENKKEKNWLVWGTKFKVKPFKTKSKAMRFANRYMKNNPRG